MRHTHILRLDTPLHPTRALSEVQCGWEMAVEKLDTYLYQTCWGLLKSKNVLLGKVVGNIIVICVGEGWEGLKIL